MNKRLLILVGVVFYMLLNVIMPMKVNALDDVLVEENPVVETNLEDPAEKGVEETEIEPIEPVIAEGQTEETEESKAIEGQVGLTSEAGTRSEEVVEPKSEEVTEPKLEEVVEPKSDEVSEPESNDTVEPTNDDLTEEVETENTNNTVQKAKITFKKVDEEGNYLPGAILQIIDKATGEPIVEWTTGDGPYEYELSAGEYIIHEVKAPDGYEKVEDASFKVEVIINEEVIGNVTVIDGPIGDAPLYYVTINNEEYEVYCVNQGLKTPNGNEYSGKILTPEELRNFTKQETDVDILDENGNRHYTLLTEGVSYKGFYADSETISDYDVSDQTMTDQELYDKTLDIIYHRNIIKEKFPDMNLTDEEIRFITEWALKNYLNARITTSYETVRYFRSNGSAAHYYYYVGEDGQPIMDENGKPVTIDANGNPLTGSTYFRLDHKFYYREYRYAPNEEGAINGVIIDPGNGDSFGQIAKGLSVADRERYAILYYYLIGDDDNDGKPDHPEDMELYMYSPLPIEGEELDTPYQNVLGIAGFFKDIKIVGKDIEITDKYSTETVDVVVRKVWDDKDNQYETRPESITMKLSNGMTVTLNDENDWTGVIEGLPKYNKGQLITYTWEEESIPNGYILVNSEVDEYLTTITNQYPLRNLTVTKVWADDENESKKRPENVTVTLLANGKEYDTIVLSEENEWKHEFIDLPVYNDGEEITWDVREENVPEGYVASYEYDDEKGIIIHNVLGQGGEEPPTDNPQTGDNIMIYLLTMIISIIGFVSGKKYLQNNN